MRLTIRTLSQWPDLAHQMRRLHRTAWPAFLRDDEVNTLWPRLYTTFPNFQLALCDASRTVLAIGNTIPIVWDGTPSGLPDRIADLLAKAFRSYERGIRPTALSALAAIVDPRHRAAGLSTRIVRAMSIIARRNGLSSLVAPVRPSSKGRYPLTPMKQYVKWRRPDGSPFDPWLRVHWRLGARVLRITPRGNTVTASVGEWEAWTGMRFPATGRYVVPEALEPIRVDRARKRVAYQEANVWVLHPVRARG
jgi:hypothetical protein